MRNTLQIFLNLSIVIYAAYAVVLLAMSLIMLDGLMPLK